MTESRSIFSSSRPSDLLLPPVKHANFMLCGAKIETRNLATSVGIADVEDITSKAGSARRFPVFLKMLVAALQQQSDTATVDLLEPADLEALRSKRGAESGHTQVRLPKNKCYLILSCVGEFEKVHYPLPLTLCEEAEPARLREMIRRLRTQLAERPAEPIFYDQVPDLFEVLTEL